MNNKYKIRRIFWIIFDAVLIAAGITITPFGILGWRKTGFMIEAWSEGGTFEGRSSFFTIILGIVMILYGLFDMRVIRRSCKDDHAGLNI